MTPFLILEILTSYTSEDHGLQMTQIQSLLEQDYRIHVERKAISRILNELRELSEMPGEYDWKHPMRFSIKCDSLPRSSGNIRTNWRLCREFEDGEVRLLLDLLRSVEGYPVDRLTKKLQRLGSISLAEPCRHSLREAPGNCQMPISIDCIERGIRESKKITFTEGEADGAAHHTVSPYHTVFCQGVYYLIGYDEDSGDVHHFPIRLICNAAVTDLPAQDPHNVKTATGSHYDFRQYVQWYLKG